MGDRRVSTDPTPELKDLEGKVGIPLPMSPVLGLTKLPFTGENGVPP